MHAILPQSQFQMTRLLERTQQLKKYSVLNEKGLDKFLNLKIIENAGGLGAGGIPMTGS